MTLLQAKKNELKDLEKDFVADRANLDAQDRDEIGNKIARLRAEVALLDGHYRRQNEATKLRPKTLKAKQAPPSRRSAAVQEVQDFFKWLRDYGRAGKPAIKALIDELHMAYLEANFGVDGDYNTDLDEADIALLLANALSREIGLKPLDHKDLTEVAKMIPEKS